MNAWPACAGGAIPASRWPCAIAVVTIRDNPHSCMATCKAGGSQRGPPALRRLWGLRTRSVRLAARTLVFQAGNGGSIPPRTMPGVRSQGSGVSGAEHRPVAQWRSVPFTADRLGVRVPPGRLAAGAQVLAAASPALTRRVRVQVPRALLAGGDRGVV